MALITESREPRLIIGEKRPASKYWREPSKERKPRRDESSEGLGLYSADVRG